jgi:DNA-binding transcriptional ArsR family regulator
MTATATEPHQPALADIQIGQVMQALADDIRLAIVATLAEDGERVCGSMELGVTKATRSHHFKVLREAGITHTRLDGTRRYVSLRRDDLDERFPGLLDALLGALLVRTP